MMATAHEPLILVDKPVQGLAVVRLNRPAARNALSMALRAEFVSTMAGLAAEGVRVVVLTGQGRAFCAGLDLGELSQTDAEGPSGHFASASSHDVCTALTGFPGVVIGAVNGAAVTGGLELALACDLMIASSEARFADTHGRVGVMPGWGLSQRLPRLIGGPRAKEMSLTGNFIDAAKAEAWGLVNRVVPPEELLPQATALAREMLELRPEVLLGLKRIIDDGLAVTLSEGLRLEATRSAQFTFDAEELHSKRAEIESRGRARPRSAHELGPCPEIDAQGGVIVLSV